MGADILKPTDLPADKNLIQNPSPELLHFAIRTFPLNPRYADIDLEVSRIQPQQPNIKLELDYNPRIGTFEGSFGCRTQFSTNKALVEAQTATLIKMPKPTEVEVRMGEEGFGVFNETFRQLLESSGFKITRAAIAATSYHSRDDGGFGGMAGEDMISGVTMSTMSINLRNPEGIPELDTWFEKVKQEAIQK